MYNEGWLKRNETLHVCKLHSHAVHYRNCFIICHCYYIAAGTTVLFAEKIRKVCTDLILNCERFDGQVSRHRTTAREPVEMLMSSTSGSRDQLYSSVMSILGPLFCWDHHMIFVRYLGLCRWLLYLQVCLLVCYIRIYWIFIFVFATFVYQSSDSPVLAGQIICTAVPLQRHPVNSVQGNNRSLFGQLHGTCKCTKCRILMLTACGTYSYRSALGC